MPLGLGKAPFGGLFQPLDSLFGVRFNAFSVNVTRSEQIFRLFVPLFDRFAKPFHPFGGILFDSLSVKVTVTQSKLCIGVSLRRGSPKPLCRLRRVLFDLITDVVIMPDGILSLGTSALRGFFDQFGRCCFFLFLLFSIDVVSFVFAFIVAAVDELKEVFCKVDGRFVFFFVVLNVGFVRNVRFLGV